MGDFVRDVLFAVRSSTSRRNLLTTSVVILTLGLGIGAATTVYTAVDAFLIKKLPFPNAQQLVSVELRDPETPRSLFGTVATVGLLEAWQRDASDIARFAGFQTSAATVSDGSLVRPVLTVGVTSSVFDVLGVQPLYGRRFVSTDEARGAAKSAILSFAAWRQLFGSNRSVLGREIALQGSRYRIIGIMPRGFRIPLSIPETDQQDAEIWLPLASFYESIGASLGSLMPAEVIARTRAQSLGPIEATLDRIARAVPQSPDGPGSPPVVQVNRLSDVFARAVRGPLLLVAGAVLLLLALACLNVTNLLAARAITRDREFATRLAIGASPRRLLRQVMTEGLLLSLFGAGVGVILTYLLVSRVAELGAMYLPDVQRLGVDIRVLSFSALLALVVGPTVSAWAVVRAARGSPAEAMKARQRSQTIGARRFMQLLVILEFALGLVLLNELNTLGRSFLHLTQLRRGYDPTGLVVGAFMLPTREYATPEARRAFGQNLITAIEGEAGITSAAISSGLPLVGGMSGTVVDAELGPHSSQHRVSLWNVSSDFFRTMGVRVRTGLLPNFDSDPTRIAVDSAAAALLFGSRNPIGRRVTWSDGANSGVVSAVVDGVRDVYLNQENNTPYQALEPHVYLPWAGGAPPVMRLVVRTSGDPARAADEVRRTLVDLDSRLRMTKVVPMQDLLRAQTARERFLVAFALVFGGIAIVLAAAGIFAIVSYSTEQRRQEFGVRLALGSSAGRLLSMVLREVILLTAAGALLGTAITLAAAGVTRNVLFETPPTDAFALTTTLLLVLLVAIAGSAVPALTAARTPATVALLNEDQ